jgi:2-succinyl-5-enolpyruvyl-6-hydroxy-3-cyclohexene-1-carboxylate synthase
VEAFAASVGWPVLADPRSGCRGLDHAVAAFDSLLRHQPFARAHAPSVVLHLGEPPASKVLGQWLQSVDATHVQVLDRPVVIDPLQIVTHRVTAPVGPVLAALVGTLSGAVDTPWWARWRHAAQAAQRAIAGELSDGSLSEPGVARWLTAQPGAMVVASSMPIRDVEWFGVHEQQAEVLSNRGANGIDGVIATGIGVALGRSDRRCTVLLGDVALLHDSSSFTALARREVQVRVVVVDNDGGGIFSFLPQATALPHERFEQLFGTPHGTDLAALARAHGLWVREADTVDQLADAWHLPGSGVVRVRTDRAQNVRVHDALHAAVAAELG